jgi:hypothetical protein
MANVIRQEGKLERESPRENLWFVVNWLEAHT